MLRKSYNDLYLMFILIIFFGILTTASLTFFGPFAGFVSALLLQLSLFAGNYYILFQNGIIFDLSYILLSLLTVFTTITIFNYFYEERRRRFIKKAFSHYVAPSVVASLLKKPSSLNLSLTNRDVTILFRDIRNFTSLSETAPTAEVSIVLNKYFSLMTNIILRNNGMVDKYIGDAIMAVWGNPLDDPKHATHAVRAALEMSSAADMHSDILQLSSQSLEYGIGLNSGQVSAGNVGSKRRFDYTVLGDNVNLSSRIENISKKSPSTILISEATKEKAGAGFDYIYIDTVSVPGRSQQVKIFEPKIRGDQSDFL